MDSYFEKMSTKISGNIFSKQLVETEMNYTNNSISKTENFDLEAIKNKFV